MENLHIWLVGLVVTTLISIIGWLLRGMLKKIWNTLEERLEKLEDWKHDLDVAGGTVTRDIHFKWCGEVTSKCGGEVKERLSTLEDWRHCMSDQGGPLMKDEHVEICERVSAKVASTLGQKFSDELKHERELFQKDLKLIQLTLERDVLTELKALNIANNRK